MNVLIQVIIIAVIYRFVGYVSVLILTYKNQSKPIYRRRPWMTFSIPKNVRTGTAYAETLKYFENNHVNTFIGYPFFTKVVFTKNMENIKAILSNTNDYSIGLRRQLFYPLLRNGIFATDGSQWKTSRAMLKPQFSRHQISQLNLLEVHYQNFSNHINNLKGTQFDLQELFGKLALDASTEFLFGESVFSLDPKDSAISQYYNSNNGFEYNFKKLSKFSLARNALGSFSWLAESLPGFKEPVSKIHQFVQLYVQKALNLTSDQLNEKSDGYIFLYELVKQTRDPQILQDELLSIMLAGRGTTSMLLTFLFMELSNNPKVFEKLKTEIIQEFGHGTESISFESMKQCKYLKYCVNEALRMHPPVARNLRESAKPVILPRGGGPLSQDPTYVPKGTSILMDIYCLHRSPEYFGENVQQFVPERWETIRPGSAFVPFGTGPRICLGQQFALTEASYVTIRMCQNFNHITTSDSYPPRIQPDAVSRLMDGLNVEIQV